MYMKMGCSFSYSKNMVTILLMVCIFLASVQLGAMRPLGAFESLIKTDESKHPGSNPCSHIPGGSGKCKMSMNVAGNVINVHARSSPPPPAFSSVQLDAMRPLGAFQSLIKTDDSQHPHSNPCSHIPGGSGKCKMSMNVAGNVINAHARSSSPPPPAFSSVQLDAMRPLGAFQSLKTDDSKHPGSNPCSYIPGGSGTCKTSMNVAGNVINVHSLSSPPPPPASSSVQLDAMRPLGAFQSLKTDDSKHPGSNPCSYIPGGSGTCKTSMNVAGNVINVHARSSPPPPAFSGVVMEAAVASIANKKTAIHPDHSSS